jgi:hypothetical protein
MTNGRFSYTRISTTLTDATAVNYGAGEGGRLVLVDQSHEKPLHHQASACIGWQGYEARLLV